MEMSGKISPSLLLPERNSSLGASHGNSSPALLMKNGPTHSENISPASDPGRNSPIHSPEKCSPASSTGKRSPVLNSGKNSPISFFGRNSPIPTLKNIFGFGKGSPSPSRKNASHLSDSVSQADSNSVSSSPFLERKFPFLQNWSRLSRSPEASPSSEKRLNISQSSRLSRKDSVQVTPSYSYLSDQLRRVSAGSLQCALFCGGQSCKYEGATHWGAEDMAIKGLYSHWVTDRILAMARPSTKQLQEDSVIQEFQRHGIGSVINLQQPGEHAQCGEGLESTSGFSYRPEDLMDRGMYFYNYGWADYGVPTLQSLLGMVKVMDFALSEGKVAVHCHAGLGRTGVLIACYLVYSRRLTGDQAIAYVRQKRPGSIQTRPQVEMVRDFSQFLSPLWTFFPSPSKPHPLQELLHNQLLILHGDHDDHLKYIPKVMHDLCVRLVECCSSDSDLNSVFSRSLTDKSASLAGELTPPTIQVTASCTEMMEGEEPEGVATSLTCWCEGEVTRDMEQKLEDIEGEVNGCLDWQLLHSECSLSCLLHLCSRFLTTLKDPVVGVDEDLSWLLLHHTKDWKKHCTPNQVVLKRVAQTFSRLLQHVGEDAAERPPHSRDSSDHSSTLMRGVAKRLATDLCQDSTKCGSCESSLFKYWRLNSLSATHL